MEQMTAAQKLGRLKLIGAEITRQLDGHTKPGAKERYEALDREQAAILRTVGLPPFEVMGNPWGEAWAASFSATFPGFDTDTLNTWFMNACAAGAMRGYEEGQAAGVNERLRETLEAIRGCSSIRCAVRFTRDGGEPRTLHEFVQDALDAPGLPSIAPVAMVQPAPAKAPHGPDSPIGAESGRDPFKAWQEAGRPV